MKINKCEHWYSQVKEKKDYKGTYGDYIETYSKDKVFCSKCGDVKKL